MKLKSALEIAAKYFPMMVTKNCTDGNGQVVTIFNDWTLFAIDWKDWEEFHDNDLHTVVWNYKWSSQNCGVCAWSPINKMSKKRLINILKRSLLQKELMENLKNCEGK